MYERLAAKAAVDAAADIVVGNHAHILRGTEQGWHNLPRSRTLRHGNPRPEPSEECQSGTTVGFEPDPGYSAYPFHPEAKNAMIAVCEVDRGGACSAGFIPGPRAARNSEARQARRRCCRIHRKDHASPVRKMSISPGAEQENSQPVDACFFLTPFIELPGYRQDAIIFSNDSPFH